MKNDQLEYYVKHNISPEHQNIKDMDVHYARRKKLYRQCGIPEIAFRNADMLEVGPGGGYNTLAFFYWGCKHIDLVEANPQGIKDIEQLFKEQGIDNNKYDIFECTVENYDVDRKYDIIIAEGFLSNLYNREEVIEKLKKLVSKNGIIVITCSDKVGYFIEIIKRLIGHVMTKEIPTFEEKVKYLVDVYKPQLERLRGVSKLPEDWVKDNIFNPEITNEMQFTLAQAIQCFEKDFEILGSSPHIFTDYSWSKDIWYDYKKDYIKQFDKKRLSFLMANMPEIILEPEQVKILVECFSKIKDIEVEYENTLLIKKVSEIIEVMNSMKNQLRQIFLGEGDFVKVFYEIEDVLSCIQNGNEINMDNYPHFSGAFGRTQQYISFVKE